MNLNIESHEGNIYLACVEDGDSKRYVMDNSNRPRRFVSISEVKTHLSNKNFDKVQLVQATPYDEMVGLQSTADNAGTPIHWR